MPIYAPESGVAITDVRVSNFRSLANIEVELNDLTVLIGANNAGKTSFLDAMFASIGSGRKMLGQDDIRLMPEEAMPPKDRQVVVDVRIRPVDESGTVVDTFPAGSFWTALWGPGIVQDDQTFAEFMAFRTTLAWRVEKADYAVERLFLKEWKPFEEWIDTPTQDKPITAAQLEPVALHYIDAKRDLEDDLRRQGSFWRRMTDDLGLSEADVAAMEAELTGINQQIVDKSSMLQRLKTNLADLQAVVSADSAGIDIAPVARKLRDLSKGVDVSFSTAGAQSFPLARHGMGTRSLASLLVFRAFAAWRGDVAAQNNDKLHSVLALEEPESHLHPQAQRSLFAHIKKIKGQRVVSTHSPYFAGQAQLEDLRLFIKRGGDTSSRKLNLSELEKADDIRKLQETVIESRGDILFAKAVVLFEGQTEEQALPIWAEAYWGASIHELGFSFVRANGTDYFPFIWLAKSLEIPWYVMADGEAKPVGDLEAALKKAGQPDIASSTNVVVVSSGNNFETQLLADGYIAEIEIALNEAYGHTSLLDEYIERNHGLDMGKGKGARDYKSNGGRLRAAADAMKSSKTRLAKPLARTISGLKDPDRRFPKHIEKLFSIIGQAHGIEKQAATAEEVEET
ncbi:ATP-dependent nuclease [Burkholderia pseudomallei]|uniref:ATP-dependent nuclease n=1 Tax=Burkholderia pseudomallei TaxID=28450 RepID=UPI000F062AA8|nr:AAA family ATPase [Burkholderia pseudomallei]MCW0053347.1 AAA family ATPase [Burkholderia pseudomallei]VBU66105.1 ATP-dependent endonuclease [Burkholderia pseudomallei]